MSKCTKSKIHPSNHTTRSYNKSKSHTKHEFTPEGNLILAKVSHVNEALVDFKTEIYDEQEGEECHLVRILRIGPAIKDESVAPGTLVIVHKSAGLYLQKLSDRFVEDYYLLSEDDIIAHVDL